MNWLRRFVSLRPDPTAAEAILNPATTVTAEQLIALQVEARRLTLSGRRAARTPLAGQHHSRFRGRGMDYQESRSYQAGDDIRNMDWRVTARTDRPHTKLFQEERERPVMVCVDLAPGLFFATRGRLKSVVAAHVAALLGWSAVDQGDRVGALVFNRGNQELRPRAGHRAVLAVIQLLVAKTDPLQGVEGGGDEAGLSAALARLCRVVRPGSLVFVISDFQALDGDAFAQLARLRRHNDVIALQILDPIEVEAPPPGRYAIRDAVGDGVLDLRSAASRRDYERELEAREERLQTGLVQAGIPLLRLLTTDRIERVLQAYFGRRSPALTPRSAIG
jgi:uncharacterized protein (DUF58 family)